MRLKGKKGAFLGDSITLGVYTDIFEGIHKRMDKKYCDVAAEIIGFDVINYAVSGTSISAGSTVLPEESFIRRYMNIDDNVDFVCVLGGTNDFGTNVQLGYKGSKDENTFYGALNGLCNGIKEKFNKKPIIFITPLYRKEEKNDINLDLQQYRNAIYDIAEKQFGFYVVDGMSLGLNENCHDISELLFDGLHPNPPAHKIIGRELANILNTL